MKSSLKRWWGRFSLSEGHEARWRIGELDLWVQRQRGEWRVVHGHRTPADDAVALTLEPSVSEPAQSLASSRFAVSERHDDIELLPVMPDRPVVIRTESRLGVPPGEEVTLHLSVPVFVRVGVGSPSRTLLEVPTAPMSDTWFGPSTVSGELGYALRTPGVIDLAEMPRSAHRAIAALRIKNLGKDLLGLERVSLPTMNLDLYRRSDGSLWTDVLTMERDQEGMASVKVGPRTPQEEGSELISTRRIETRGVLFRAFGALFTDWA